ncbi:hypothetical protein A9Z40_00420 [Microbacterium arborescens]|uniref:Uncharacterized protein n=1 Tax=Microbacterium arborescens TaxID=33883 RepID=A0ABX2WMN4_9MICO|nr:hypothetical protein A9Z40_00420 [Microbacterium arborescens]
MSVRRRSVSPGFFVGAIMFVAIVVTFVVLGATNFGRGNDDAPPVLPSDVPRPRVTGAVGP